MITTFFQFVTSLLVLALGLIVYVKNTRSDINSLFFRFTLSIFSWLFFYSLSAFSPGSVLFFKLGYVAVSFIPTTWLHFNCCFLRSKALRRIIIPIGYTFSVVFGLLAVFTDYLVAGLWEYSWGFYPKVFPPVHAAFLLFFVSYFSISITSMVLTLWKDSKNIPLLQLNRIRYLLWAGILGTFAGVDFVPNYGINVYPCGFFFMLSYVFITFYSINKYRLLDTIIVFTRTSIFIGVYSVVLGIPFVLAFGFKRTLVSFLDESWWMGPLICSTVLATVGPFIYFYIEKKAEEKLFQEQRRYQNTLRQASSGMGRIKDLGRLVNLIVHIVTKTVRLEHALIYLINQEQGYSLRSSRSTQARFSPIEQINPNSAISKYLLETKNPIVYEEIKQKTEDYGDLNLARLENALKELNAALVVPSFVEDRLLAIIVLGRKESGSLYTEDDLNVFSILANQAALAIENAQFYDDMKKTHEQLFKAEKMATIGTMADGLSHQINNRLHALGFIASDVLDTIKMKKDLPMSAEFKEMLVDIEHGLTRIQENVTQGGEIVRGLLKYTRKGEEGFAAVDLNQLLDSAVEMTQFKIKSGEMNILREFGADIPKIKGNFTQLQEVFFNLIDNAYDAMMQRKSELKESGYEPTIKISTENSNNGHLVISVHDNGIGIKGDDKNKLFTPFFTTKLSSKKGTGLGLYVIRKLIEENHGGKVVYESKYQEGTRVTLDLPIYSAN